MTKDQIQKGWLGWLDAYVVTQGLSLAQRGDLHGELAKEAGWAVWSLNYTVDIQRRLDKYAALLAANAGDLTAFDPYYQARIDFLTWMST